MIMLGYDWPCSVMLFFLCPEKWPCQAPGSAHLACGHRLVPQHHPLRLQDHFLVYQLCRAGQEGLGQGRWRAGLYQMCSSTPAPPSWWGETRQRGPQPIPGVPDRAGDCRTLASLTHLQDECFAMKGNLDGVHSIPIFLWQGQRVAGRWGKGRGRRREWGGLAAHKGVIGRAGFQQFGVGNSRSLEIFEQLFKNSDSNKCPATRREAFDIKLKDRSTAAAATMENRVSRPISAARKLAGEQRRDIFPVFQALCHLFR